MFRVFEGIHWKCVPVSAGNPEEIRHSASGEYEKVSLVDIAALAFDASRSEIDSYDLRHLDLNILVANKNLAEVKSCIRGRQSARGNLIEQGLELLIIVFIDQSDPQAGIGGEPFRAVKSGKATADDHHVFFCSSDLSKLVHTSAPTS